MYQNSLLHFGVIYRHAASVFVPVFMSNTQGHKGQTGDFMVHLGTTINSEINIGLNGKVCRSRQELHSSAPLTTSVIIFLPWLLQCSLHLSQQNAAARLLTKTNRRSHITPILASLHWLLVLPLPTFLNSYTLTPPLDHSDLLT